MKQLKPNLILTAVLIKTNAGMWNRIRAMQDPKPLNKQVISWRWARWGIGSNCHPLTSRRVISALLYPSKTHVTTTFLFRPQKLKKELSFALHPHYWLLWSGFEHVLICTKPKSFKFPQSEFKSLHPWNDTTQKFQLSSYPIFLYSTPQVEGIILLRFKMTKHKIYTQSKSI